jgi:acyl-CoA thioester hydrolase
MREFSWPIRVYYEDTDAAGVVYHSNYIKFMERARTEWLRSLGFSQDLMCKESGKIIVISNLDIKFLKPARLDDLLQVKSILRNVSAASFLIDQEIKVSSDKICMATVKGVCLDAITFKPKRLPAELKLEFSHAN